MKLLAKFLALPRVRDYLIRRAMKTPYFHIVGDDGTAYMERYWLFNGYGEDHVKKYPWIPYSARIHWIKREDRDDHHHDHPANCRTVILENWYEEERIVDGQVIHYLRLEGETASIDFGEFHKITYVPPGGTWTLFILGPKLGEWGFLVNGVKILWRDYLKGPYSRS